MRTAQSPGPSLGHCQSLGLAVVLLLLLTQQVLPGQEAAATVSGVIAEAGRPGQPVRRALVTATSLESSLRLNAVTDDDGRFEIPHLRPGRYMVTASKPAYLTTTLGARQPGRPGTPVVLTAGQRLTDIRIGLARGGVISGTIRDTSGSPAPNLTVAVVPVDRIPVPIVVGASALGEPSLYTAVTDDRGMYRIHGLSPAEYFVAVLPSLSSNTSDGPRALAIEMEIAGANSAARSGARPMQYGYAPIFYPGTPAGEEAWRVRVATGDVREGLDMTFDLVPAGSIEGSVFLPDGKPGEGLVVVLGATGPVIPSWPGGRATANADGRFTIANVRPGRYTLGAFAGKPGEQAVYATTELTATGADVSGIVLHLQPATSLRGRVVLEGSTAPPPPTRLMLQRRVPSGADRTTASAAGLMSTTASSVSGASNKDGSFEITPILPGRFALTVSVPTAPGRLWLKSAVAEGRDLLDAPLEFLLPLRDIADAVVTLTDRPTELTGRLQTAAQQPATEYFVVVFSADRAHWFPGTRRTRAVRPASDGVFSVTQLPAGVYLVAAVTDAATDEWQQPSFLEQLATLAIPVTIPDGGTVRQDLQIAR